MRNTSGERRTTKDERRNTFSRFLVLFLVLFVALYFYKLGSTGLIDVDEPRYAETGREMLESGNFIVPYFNYEVRYDKPIFFYWLEAASMSIFGVNEFAARLPSALSGLLCTFMVFLFVRTFYPLYCALLSVLILLSTLEFAALSRFSITDMSLCAFESGAIICFFLGCNYHVTSGRFFKQQVKNINFWYILGFLFLSFAFLTKGPVAILICGLVLIPFFWWIEKLDYFFKSYSFYVGLCLFLLLTFPWYVLVHLATNGEFTKIFFGMHNFSRYTSVVSGHKGSVFYFIPVVLIGFLPWTFFLVQSVSFILKKGLKSLLKSQREQIPWFCLWWFIIVFLFFSVSKTKLLTYILPLFPALSVILAVWFHHVFEEKSNLKDLVVGLGVFFLFSLITFYLCITNLSVFLPREVKGLNLDILIIIFAFILLVGVSMAWTASNKNPPLMFLIILGMQCILYFSLITFLLLA